MRYLFFAILTINIILLVFNLNILGQSAPPDDGRQPEIIREQQNSELVRIVGQEQAITPPSDETVPDAASPSTVTTPPTTTTVVMTTPQTQTAPVTAPPTPTDTVATPVPPTPPVPSRPNTPTPEATQCLVWSSFNDQQVANAKTWLKRNYPELKTSTKTQTEASTWAVLIPGAKNATQADAKVAELKLKGINDLFIIRAPGPNQYAISAGVFSSESNAKKAQDIFKSQGVSTVIDPRGERRSTLVIQNANKNLNTAISKQSQFKGTRLSPC